MQVGDQMEGTMVDMKTFDWACQRFKVNFTSEELRKIQKLFGANDSIYLDWHA